MDGNGATINSVGNTENGFIDVNDSRGVNDSIGLHDCDIQSSNKRRRIVTATATATTTTTIINTSETSEAISNITVDCNHDLNQNNINDSVLTDASTIDVDYDENFGSKRDDTPHQPPLYQPKQKMKKKHMDPKILQFRTIIQNCCKNNDLYTAIQSYNDAISNQIRIEAPTFYNLLHLCSNDSITCRTLVGMDDRETENNNKRGHDPATIATPSTKMIKIHIGTPKTSLLSSSSAAAATSSSSLLRSTGRDSTMVVSIEERRMFAERVKCHMDQLKIPLTENAYTAMVRVYCSCCYSSRKNGTDDTSCNDDIGTLSIAERIITEAETQQQCKVRLRLYTPLLLKYCELGLLLRAIQTWHRISKQEIILTELEYCALLQCCNMVDSRNTVAAVVVFERVLTDLAEDILIPSHTTRHTIMQWFQSKHAMVHSDEVRKDRNEIKGTNATVGQDDTDIENLLQQIRVPYENSNTGTMGPVQIIAGDTCQNTGWIISDECGVDTNTGTLLSGCLKDSKLQPISISSTTWDCMKNMNENIAITNKVNDTDTTNYQGGGKGRKVILDERTIQQRRSHWDQFHSFLSKYDTGIDVLIDGANVGYYEQNFNGAPKHVDYHQINWMVHHVMDKLKQKVLLIMHSRHFASNFMPKYAQPIVQGWIEQNILYQTPPGMNDDWFWLHAALHFGPGTCIVTNDEMRDHHFQMIAPRSFIRWRDRHQIHFSFGRWITHDPNESRSDQNRQREVVLQYPDPYSRRIQRVLDGLVIPLPKRGDTNRFMDGVFIADDNEPQEEMYLCIRPRHRATPNMQGKDK